MKLIVISTLVLFISIVYFYYFFARRWTFHNPFTNGTNGENEIPLVETLENYSKINNNNQIQSNNTPIVSTTIMPSPATITETKGESELSEFKNAKTRECSEKCIERFNIEIFQEPNFKNKITGLKDAPEQNRSVIIHRPIRSIRIRVQPNDNWRFTQSFSVVMYLQHDPTYRVVFRVPEGVGIQDHQVLNTDTNEELLGWMSNYDAKIIVFTVGNYNPLEDLYDESSRHSRLVLTPTPITTTDDLDVKYTWINQKAPTF